ncbi:nicotinate-nucleotide adenylyltransferase-like protein [Theileria orientalis strain Shintoku]|uniref:Nicotinate-nucleotide adenylyltransferase-like protein n=1 Tax=Theileria orientalis strain Shintoku TaxID=869250 RepID=J4C3T9_THEOR|nr:nicotinate-nucleotide adenylyltransferase-like protein [Theileria orientalis strain Shintoku]PVC50643.1 nicotinate-nucleotide adenylyltransferase-like protein [Theileria orientalis]BAM41021.1 nicotinate-nucleotide adenylyltransferase-like protein [Theileria orientalis strain Shintoku]|eukprot:XP_009691322.1 nicotinate-nucleotide adenylyltransferase-like protein [Theileria orientalis strain Shintoku]
MMNNLKKVLLFCGAFDPITAGHMLMLNLCIKTNFFNEIRIMPSGERVDKQYKTSDTHRTKMCEIAIDVFKKEYPNTNIIFSNYEMELQQTQDTYFTVKHFQDTEKDKEFYFFLGSDILPEMFEWPHSNELIQITKFLIAKREGYDIKTDDANKLNSYKLLDDLLTEAGVQKQTSPASSTEAREKLNEGKKCGNVLLHPDVMKYVEDNNLYGLIPYTNMYP